MKKALFSLALVFCLTACSSHKVENPIRLIPAESRPPASEISANWLNNPKVTRLDQLRGKVVLLNFWATWCGPCRMEIPGLVKIRKKHQGKGFEVLGLSVDQADPKDPESQAKLRAVILQFMDANKIEYPVGLTDASSAQAYQISGIPASFLIDKNGKVSQRLIGLYPEDALEDAVVRLLGEPQ